MKVWLLQHVHEFDDGHESVKLIGVYSTENGAVAVRNRLSDQPGFCSAPEGWSLFEHEIDSRFVGWSEGYCTYEPILVPATLNGMEFCQPVQAWRESEDTFTIAHTPPLAPGVTLHLHFSEGTKVHCRPHKLGDGTLMPLADGSSVA